ncbi:MAG TPA: XrtA/PEP-CTERM system TPR-repeat protein PrsT [Gammaproteobacteria bacterium]|nr:XrtA/PEP-CTERM system TPR-repeat protein PrsT [Gammaproteobacteria bacterium]
MMTRRRLQSALVSILLLSMGLALAACGGGSVSSHLAKAHQFLGEGKYRSAMIEYKNVLQKKPDQAQARFGLGQAYLALGDAADAQEQLQRAQKLGLNAGRITLPLSKAFIQQGDYDKALSLLKGDTVKDQAAEVAVLQGKALLGQGKIGAAQKAYSHALSINPKLAAAHVGQARIAAMHQDWAKAQSLLAAALKADAGNAPAWMLRGQVDFQQHDLKAAQAAFQKVSSGKVKHDSTAQLRFMARVHLADVQIVQNQIETAQKSVKLLLKQAPKHPLANYLQALIDVRQKKLSDAADHLQTALQGTPKYVPALALLGAVKLQQGQGAQAQMYLSSAVSIDPNNARVRQLLADAQMSGQAPAPNLDKTSAQLAQAGAAPLHEVALTQKPNKNNTGDLAQLQQKASQAPNNPGLQFTLAQALLERGENQQALSVLNRIPDAANATGLTRDRLTIAAYLRTQNLPAALDAVKKMLKAHPKDADAYVLASDVYMIANHNDKAKAAIDKAKVIAPHASKVLLTAAVLAVRMGNQAQAKTEFHAILSESPKNVEALMGLARLAAMANDAAETTKWLEQARKAAPKALAPRIVLVRLYMLQKEPDKALSVAQETAKAAPHNAVALNLLAAAQWAAGHKKDALDSFGKAIKAAPNNMAFRLHLARAQIAMKQDQAAEKTLQAIIDRQPSLVQASRLLALVQLRQGNKKAAFATAKHLSQEPGAQAAAAQLEGDLHMGEKQYQQAAEAYDKALKSHSSRAVVVKDFVARVRAGMKDPQQPATDWLAQHGKDVAVRSLLAQWYLQKKDMKSAAEQYEAIVKVDPKDPSALNNLAWIYGQQNNPKALELARKAHQAAPDNASVTDTLGWIELQAGHADKALKLLQDAASKNGKNPGIQYHLAVAQAKTGHKAEAKKTLQQLLGTKATFAEKSDAQQLLKQLNKSAAQSTTTPGSG